MITLEFSIKINASKQKVWETMLHPVTYRKWANAAWPDSFYEGEWAQGNNMRFISSDGSGTLTTLKNFDPYNAVFAEHIAVLNPGGIVDTDSDIAKNWIGTTEQYRFTETNGVTELQVSITTFPQWSEMFNGSWPKALSALKEICEHEN